MSNSRAGFALPLFCASAKLAVYLIAANRYGYMSDELYFLDAAEHLDLGYVDFPPLIAWLAAFVRGSMGDTLWALRLTPMLAGIGITILAADICRLLGGQRFAQWLTALTVAFAPGFVSVQSILTMNALDYLWWVAAFWFLLAYLQLGRPGHMLGLGLVLGIGLLSKLSILALCVAIPLSLLCFRRDVLGRREVWLAALLAGGVASPFALWQLTHDFPFLEFIRAYNSSAPVAMVLQNPVLGLLLTMNPAYAVVWGPGALLLLIARDPNQRVVGAVAWLSLALFLVAGVKFYFAVPLFAVFMAAGALFWERRRVGRVPLRIGLMVIALSGVATLPIAAPILPADSLQKLANYLRDSEEGRPGVAPASVERYFPHFAEMHGWPELVEATAGVVAGLSPAERDSAVLVAAHYGQAAALNQLDRQDRLPPAHSGHMSYHLWSEGVGFPRGVFVGFSEVELTEMYRVVDHRATLRCERCMRREQGLHLYYVAEPRLSDAQIRRSIKRYYFF